MSRRSISSVVAARLICATLLLLPWPSSISVPRLVAQTKVKLGRAVVRTVKPDYPAIVKNAGIGGRVRLKAVVLPDGTVTRVDTIGGNPILAESAAKAVMRWKYVPSPWQTDEQVWVNFDPFEP